MKWSVKFKLFVLLFFIIVFVYIKLLYIQNKKLYEENRVLKTNQYHLINKLSSKELTLTNREFLEMYSLIIQRIKDLDIKSKYIERYINYEYRFKDTAFVPVFKDTIRNLYVFSVEKECYKLYGEINSDSVKTDLVINDSIDVFLYKQKNKQFSWWYRLWNPSARYIMNAVVYSSCLNDTIGVKKNIKVIDR